MNKKLILIIALAVILMMPTMVSAKSDTALTREQKIATAKVRLEQKIVKINQKQVKKWQKLGARIIRKDINRLNRLISITTKKTTLDTDQKGAIINDINADIASLNTLKAKINADTDLTTVKADVKSIPTVGSFNGKYLPRINHKTTTTETTN